MMAGLGVPRLKNNATAPFDQRLAFSAASLASNLSSICSSSIF